MYSTLVAHALVVTSGAISFVAPPAASEGFSDSKCGSFKIGFNPCPDKAPLSEAAAAVAASLDSGICLSGIPLDLGWGPAWNTSDWRRCSSSSFMTGFCFPQNWHLQYRTRFERSTDANWGVE